MLHQALVEAASRVSDHFFPWGNRRGARHIPFVPPVCQHKPLRWVLCIEGKAARLCIFSGMVPVCLVFQSFKKKKSIKNPLCVRLWTVDTGSTVVSKQTLPGKMSIITEILSPYSLFDHNSILHMRKTSNPPTYILVHLLTHSSTHPSTHLSICPTTYLLSHPSTWPSFYPAIQSPLTHLFNIQGLACTSRSQPREDSKMTTVLPLA